MNEHVIYKKQYPDTVPDEIKAEAADTSDMPSWEEFIQKARAKHLQKSSPERIARSKEFIDAAIEIAELYELDLEIVQKPTSISADFSFDSGASMGFLKELISMADDIHFFSQIRNREITMSIVFNTTTGFHK